MKKQEYQKRAGTVRTLHRFLSKMLRQGKGSNEVMFDTEGRKFEYHMALVGAASWLPKEMAMRPMVVLHERRGKP